MWRLTEDEYEKLLASRKAGGAGQVREHKRGAPLATAKAAQAKVRRKAESQNSYRIVVIAKRKRAIDPDNIFPKWFIDELVRAGYIEDDSSSYVSEIVKRVERVAKGQSEETVIEIWKEKEPMSKG